MRYQTPASGATPPSIPLTKRPFDEKALQTIRMNSKSIADIEASERSHRILAGENMRLLPNFLRRGPSFKVNLPEETTPPSVLQEPMVEDDESNKKKLTWPLITKRLSAKNLNDKHNLSSLSIEKSLISPRSGNKVSLDKQEIQEIQNLSSLAAEYALRGDEATAIKIYKKALTCSMARVDGLQNRILSTETEPEYLQPTLFKILRDECYEITSSIAEIKTMTAIIHERSGEYDKAIQVCQEAKDVYERQLGQGSSNHSQILSAADGLAMMEHMTEKLNLAKQTLAERKQIHEEALRIHKNIASTKEKTKRDKLYSTLFEKISVALALEIDSLGQHHPQVADTLAFLSKIHLEKNDNSKALMSMQRAASVAEIALGTKHPRTGEKYYELGRQFDIANRDKYDKAHALLYYKKALDTFREAEGDHFRTVGSISNDLGVLLLQDRKYDEAIAKFNDSLTNYDMCPKTASDLIYADAAQVWRNLAECFMLRKDWPTAAHKFLCALDVQREAKRVFEVTKRDATSEIPQLIQDENIADTMKRLGKAYTSMKEYEKAERILLEALTIFQNACVTFKASSKHVSPLILAVKQDSIANIIFCLAEVKEASLKHDEAIQLYDESLTLRHYSDEARPKDKKLNNVHIAMCLAGIGKVRMGRGEHEMAIRAFTEAIQSAKRDALPDSHPIIQMLNEKIRAANAASLGQGDSDANVAGMVEQANFDPFANDDIEGLGTPKSKNTATPQVSGAESQGIEPIESVSTVDFFFNDDGENRADNFKSFHNDGENRIDDFKSLHERGVATKTCTPDFGTWFDAVARLEKKVQTKLKKADISGALRVQDRIVDLRRDYLARKQEDMLPRSKESQDLAKALVDLARLQSRMGVTKLAEGSFREAMNLFKASGIPKNAECMQDIEGELSRLGSGNGAIYGDAAHADNLIDSQHRPVRTQQSATFFRV